MRKIKLFTASVLLVTTVLSSSIVCSAQSGDANTDDLFKESEVQELIERADQMTVVSDKGIKQNARTITTTGTYPTRKGAIIVTPDKFMGLPIGHAAIVYSETKVVEAMPSGVTVGNNDWNQYREKVYGITVKETTPEQDAQVADWCYEQIGKPYNYNYLNPYTRNEFYCSQLIYAGYLDNFNINLDTYSWLQAVHPMELVDTNKTETIYTYYNDAYVDDSSSSSGSSSSGSSSSH